MTYTASGRVIGLEDRFGDPLMSDIRYSLRNNPNAQVGLNVSNKTENIIEKMQSGEKTIETRSKRGEKYGYVIQ